MTTLSAFLPVVTAGFAVAFFHAATPGHWLPFVLVGRAQGWSRGRTLGVTAIAGLGHAIFTAVLGLALASAGAMIEPRIGEFFPRVVGGVLIALGLYYLVRHQRRSTIERAAAGQGRRYGSDAAAVAGLLALLTFSPSEAVLPIYLANIGQGLLSFLVLAAALTVAAVSGMLVFTALFLAGADRLRLDRLERYELAMVGAGLCLIGLIVALQG